MQGWKHLLVGTGFLTFAACQLVWGGSFWLIVLPVVASGFFFFRAFRGQTGTPGADLSLAVDFIRDPFDTVLDEAAARLDGNEDEPREPRAKGGVLQQFARELGLGADASAKPAFDPDAAIERYLANRPAGTPPAETSPPAAASGFGRKGR